MRNIPIIILLIILSVFSSCVKKDTINWEEEKNFDSPMLLNIGESIPNNEKNLWDD